jgi:hypothetical protein
MKATVLQRTVYNGWGDIANLCLAAGAKFGECGPHGECEPRGEFDADFISGTALQIAVQKSNQELTRILLDARAYI